MEYFYLLHKRWQLYKYIFGELSGNSQSNTVITTVYFFISFKYVYDGNEEI